MPDYSQPGSSGTQPPGADKLPESSYHTEHYVGSFRELACPNGDRTLLATAQINSNCQNVNFYELYQLATAMLDKETARIICATGHCQKQPKELYRKWSCSNGKAQVIIGRRVYCKEEIVDFGLDPVTSSNASEVFKENSGEEGTNLGPQDNITVDISPGRQIGTSCGCERLLSMRYTTRVANCEIADFTPYINKALERVDDVKEVLSCPVNCTKDKEIVWHEWKCEARTVIINLTVKIECLPPREEEGGQDGAGTTKPQGTGGCLGMISLLLAAMMILGMLLAVPFLW